MGVGELAGLMADIADRQVGVQLLPVELGTVLEDTINGSDLRMKPDSMKIDLSWKHKELLVADNLILRKGDRVLAVGINGGQNYAILCRLSKNPARAVIGNGQYRAGDRTVVE
ncbi:hypothetical protein [Tumebacillus algifaecis]|uniref:hypothetical protein n=1 Tax=Tumebacillus algifaecis TaxID=1214604 RepID=UPI0012FD0CAE|nr:hypothetical protein [Tumebacillus algifaecis]